MDTVSFLHLTGCFLQLTMHGIEKGKRTVYSVGEVKKSMEKPGKEHDL